MKKGGMSGKVLVKEVGYTYQIKKIFKEENYAYCTRNEYDD